MPQVLVYDGRREDLRRITELLSQAVAASEGGSVVLASPDDAERLMEQALRGMCGTCGLSGDEGFYRHVLRLVDRCLIESSLRRAGGCQVKAAEILGINRNTLRSKMRHLDIRSGDFEG